MDRRVLDMGDLNFIPKGCAIESAGGLEIKEDLPGTWKVSNYPITFYVIKTAGYP